MSITGIGGGIGNASQMLSILLSRLDQSANATSGNDDAVQTSSNANGAGCQPAISGSAKPSLSSMVIGALIGEQMQSSDASASTSLSTLSMSSGQDPVQSLFSAMDNDGDGQVSQAEMESYIKSKSGTQSEADTLYGMLTQDGSQSLTETQLAARAPQPPGGMDGVEGHHGHHHHMRSGDGAADALMQALDIDGSGSVDQNELTSFVTANGGTSDQASSIFSALDTSKTNALGSADFAAAIENLQNGGNANSTSNALVMTMLNAFDRTTPQTQSVSVSA
jgi:Ca2+-binding EF-hand superfamily protein